MTPTRQSTSYFNALPSIALQWQFHKDTNLRAVYSRGLARPNIGDLVPATTVDPNQTPYPTISTGNPSLVPTLSDNIDVLVEHYLQPLGIIQGGAELLRTASAEVEVVHTALPVDLQVAV